MHPHGSTTIQDLHQDDDDDIILVSSTRERWEKLHGIEGNYKRNGNKDGAGVPTDIGEEDDILVVAVKPKSPTANASASDGFRIQHVVFAGIALSIWIMTRLWRTNKLGPIVKENGDITSSTALSTTTTTPIESEDSATDEKNVTRNKVDAMQVSSFSRDSNISVSEQGRRPEETRALARRFAQDVQLVQEVLTEKGLDPSMAPQLAMSLQSSQQIIESQRELSYQSAMLDAHQRSLDRRRSEERHRESLIARYDPDWQEKLQATRDRSYCWNASNGGISRLWWEVLSIQQFTVGVGPIWQRYFYDNVNQQEVGLATSSILKETLFSVLAQVCECESSTKQYMETESTTLSSFYSITTSLLRQVLPTAPFEHWACYGQCAILAFALLFFAILLHQGLRILSLPSLLHHGVNLIVMALFYGPQRMLGLVVATLLKMAMVDLSAGSEPTTKSGAGCSVLLLSLWVFLPLWSWQRTTLLYREGVESIHKADPVAFQDSFSRARSRLEQWYQEQMAMRYLLLSVYSALILWENTSSNTNY